MAFETVNVEHPTVTREHSGVATASGAATQLSTTKLYCANGVWVKNEDAAENIRVIAPGYPNGFLLSANTSRFFPTDDVSRIWIVRAGTSDVTVSYWGG